MQTVYSNVSGYFSDKAIQSVVEILQEGGVIMYPTDTLYGLGVDATNEEAVARVRTIKGRERDKPILAMVADMNMLAEYAVMTPLAEKLAHTFLPGALTLLLEAKTTELAAIEGEDHTVGFRMPDHELCLALTKMFGNPITSTSVNRSGFKQPRSPARMLRQLGDTQQDISLVLNAGELSLRTPSTIVDARGSRAQVVREGAISAAVLAQYC